VWMEYFKRGVWMEYFKRGVWMEYFKSGVGIQFNTERHSDFRRWCLTYMKKLRGSFRA